MTTFSEEFEKARQEYTAALEAAKRVLIRSWSLYLYESPSNTEYTMDDSSFVFYGSYPSQEAAKEASTVIRVAPITDPVWFIVRERLSANGDRIDQRGCQVHETKIAHGGSWVYRVEEGIFKTFLWPDEWIPYHAALGGYSCELFLIFNDTLPACWNEEEAKEYDMKYRVDPLPQTHSCDEPTCACRTDAEVIADIAE